MRRLLRTAPFVVLLVVGFGLGWVRLPYFAQGPGPVRDVYPLIRFEGHPRYESSGALLATTVRFEQVTPLEAFLVWVDLVAIAHRDGACCTPPTSTSGRKRRGRSARWTRARSTPPTWC